ncbi:MAG: hypothetical protein H7Y43_07485, partial [Akkermansiaceae bacterium]|nr:hypothetical protein [Verrucomicrobiales bacterium]
MNSFARKLIVISLVMSVVAAAGWFGRKAYKRTAEGKLIRQAALCLDQKDWRNASLCLQRALQINPDGVEPTAMMADLMEAAGSPTAVGWRVRVAQLEPQSAERRFQWARTA